MTDRSGRLGWAPPTHELCRGGGGSSRCRQAARAAAGLSFYFAVPDQRSSGIASSRVHAGDHERERPLKPARLAVASLN